MSLLAWDSILNFRDLWLTQMGVITVIVICNLTEYMLTFRQQYQIFSSVVCSGPGIQLTMVTGVSSFTFLKVLWLLKWSRKVNISMSSVTRIAVSQFFQYCNLHPCLSCLLYRDLPAEIIVNSSVSKIKYDHSLPYFKAAKKCFCIILQCNNFDLLVKIANFFIILSCFTFLDMLPLSLI